MRATLLYKLGTSSSGFVLKPFANRSSFRTFTSRVGETAPLFSWSGLSFAYGAGLATACGFYLLVQNRDQSVKAEEPTPGSPKSLKKAALEHGASMVQNFTPINQIHQHLCGLHVYSGDLNRQVPAHHFCGHLNDDFRQCIIYDSDEKDAKLIGVEYVVSEKLFLTLPPEEQKYWHSHVVEVKSGVLVAPRVPEPMEKAAMSDFANTYGKTVHTWQVDKYQLPLGPPQLMMSFTDESQIDEKLLRARDEKYGYNTEDIKKKRKDIETHPKVGNADWWLSGRAIQFAPVEVDQQFRGKSQ